MRIGKYNIHPIETALFRLDGGAVFGVVPKVIWGKVHETDERNRILICARSLLLDSGERRILVDTGMGENWNKRARDVYGIDNTTFSLIDSLKRLDLTPGDITDVFLTHLHFDHAGGCVNFIGGKAHIAFPNARHYVQEEQFKWAVEPSRKDKGSYRPELFMPLMDEGVLTLLRGNEHLDEGIEIMTFNGHTPMQQTIKVSDGAQTLFYGADLIPVAAQINVPYIMAYDLKPVVTAAEKEDILTRAAEEEWIIFLQHDINHDIIRVNRLKNGFSIRKV